LLDELFEHPAWRSPFVLNVRTSDEMVCRQSFPKLANGVGSR